MYTYVYIYIMYIQYPETRELPPNQLERLDEFRDEKVTIDRSHHLRMVSEKLGMETEG